MLDSYSPPEKLNLAAREEDIPNADDNVFLICLTRRQASLDFFRREIVLDGTER